MSRFRALFLIIIILGNGFIVLHGYNMVVDQLQTRLDQTYGINHASNVLGCDTTNCPDTELKSSLNDIYSRQRTIIGQ